MDLIISIAVIAVVLVSLAILAGFGKLRLSGPEPVALLTFISILFTSGLDAGLVMFPLAEFPMYENEAAYQFTNPLAVIFGSWGFLIWTFYFVTTFYFVVVEPRLKLFEIPWIKFVNNAVVITTCAFTGYLFLYYLPTYIEGISPLFKFGLVAVVVLLAVLSSTNIRYVKILSVASVGLFFALALAMWSASGMGLVEMAATLGKIGSYFNNMHRFVTPMSDHHAFYLYWWFAWSIMIGQFVARFVRNLATWQLLVALLVFPSIPLALWFSVIYFYYTQEVAVSGALNVFMVVVGVVFVLNSLDSLTRLYTDNLNLKVERLGGVRYVLVHWTVIFGLVLLYQFTPFEIEWVGLVVIALYLVIGYLIFRHRKRISSIFQPGTGAGRCMIGRS